MVLRGFGDSQILPGDTRVPDYGPTAYAKDLEVLLEKLNISKAWLIGHSLGGTIALLAASLMREKVKGVICLNAGGGIYLKEEFDRFRNAGQKIVKFRPRWLSYVRFLDWVFARSQVWTPLDQQPVAMVNGQRESPWLYAFVEPQTGQTKRVDMTPGTHRLVCYTPQRFCRPF